MCEQRVNFNPEQNLSLFQLSRVLVTAGLQNFILAAWSIVTQGRPSLKAEPPLRKDQYTHCIQEVPFK